MEQMQHHQKTESKLADRGLETKPKRPRKIEIED